MCRRLLLAAFLVPCINPSTIAAQAAAADSVAVQRAHTKWFEGLLAEDTVAVSGVLASDVTLGFPAGNVMPRATFLRHLQTGGLFYDTAEHLSVRIRLYGAAAVINGRSTLAVRFLNTPYLERLTYTATWVLVGGEWRMVAWQSTAAPQSP